MRGGTPTMPAADGLRFPVVVKANIGYITRVEVLDGKFLYAINVHTTGDTFNLCPADICQSSDGVEQSRGACPADWLEREQRGVASPSITVPSGIVEGATRW